MTTKSKDQQEPSMEDILSSIRRIIADEAEDDGEQGADGAPANGLDRDADALTLAAQDLDLENDVASDADDENVLELTEVVREGADVVDLDVALAQQRAIEQDQGKPGADADDPGEQELYAQGEPRSGPGDEPEASRDAGPADDSPAELPADERAAQSSIDGVRDDDMEKHETATQTKQNGIDALVSDHVAGAATGAFAKLSQAVQRTPPEVAIADDSGRSVEQFAEDMMRPMLRDWLDQNLPGMVERIVQREIQKIVRRAEDE